MQNRQSTQSTEAPPVKTATEARGARIVKGGAMRRVVIIAVALAAVALLVAFVIVR